MIPRFADAGILAANDDDVTTTIDLLHAVAKGTAHPIECKHISLPEVRIVDRIAAAIARR